MILEFDEPELLGRFTVFFGHGLLLIEAPTSTATHADWDPAAQLVHHDGDSLFVGVCPYVDGPVSVEVYEGEATARMTDGLSKVFAGIVPRPTGDLLIHDPEDLIRLEVKTLLGSERLSVWVDDVQSPSSVLVVAS